MFELKILKFLLTSKSILYILCIVYIYILLGDTMKIILTNTDKTSIYEQIATQIKDAIISGELPAGYMLPSIRTLAKDLGVSVITTKRAYEELENENFIESFQGRGSFVSAQDTNLMREKRISVVEQKFSDALNDAKAIGMSKKEIKNMINLLIEE